MAAASTRETGETVLWLGEPARSTALRKLVAGQFRLVEAAASGLATTLSDLGADRVGLVAEADGAALALRFALDHPETVFAVVLLGPTLIGANGAAAASDQPLVERLGALKPPLLAVFGTKDTIAPPEAGRHYRERLATSNVIFVYDAGHALGDDRAEAVAELVIDFLKRRELFLVRQTSDQLYR